MLRRPQLAIIDRYILAEMAMPFLFGVAVFTLLAATIGVVFDLLRWLADNRLTLAVALQILGLRLPEFIILALPMSMLLTPLLVFNTLGRRSELVALQGCGVSVYRLALPILLVGFLLAGLTFGLNETIAPQTNYQALQIQTAALRRPQQKFREKNIFYREFVDNTLSRIFYARQFDGQQMQRITILNFDQGKLDQIIVANAAEWDQKQKHWDFQQGTVYSLTPNTESSSYTSIQPFQVTQLPLPSTPLQLATETRKIEQMNRWEATQFLRAIEQTGDQKWIRRWKVGIQEKNAFPFTCVVFGLIGAALGLSSYNRSQTSRGFGLSLAMIFAYYLLNSTCISLGEGGLLSPLLAAWLSPLVGLLTGGWLLFRAAR
uniref:Permease YjgP/YjgQ family protein n=1 Tax=Cyanothece sp. (strain PCC 7425 / ATCC 29141) TaxID=395961 RepID=B8HPM1_CYAP4